MSIEKHLEQFIDALNGGKGDFDAWLECNNEKECRQAIHLLLSNQAEEYEQRIEELTAVRLTVGDGLEVYGTGEAIRRAQAYILMDSSHPSEAKDTARHFASALQVAETRIKDLQLEAQRVPEWRPIETAPKNGEHVLLWEKYSDYPVVGYFSHRRNMWFACTEHYDTNGDASVIDTLSQSRVTHWMPLTAAPAPKEGE